MLLNDERLSERNHEENAKVAEIEARIEVNAGR